MSVSVSDSIPIDYLDKMQDDKVILKELCTKVALS